MIITKHCEHLKGRFILKWLYIYLNINTTFKYPPNICIAYVLIRLRNINIL